MQTSRPTAGLSSAVAPWPVFEEDELQAVERVLRSGRVNYWTGDEGRMFEEEFARYVGTPHAVALANGTVALDAAWQALGIGPGDEVVVTPRSFMASAASIALAGGTPIFADVDRESGNITPATVERVLSDRTKAILAVHLGGWPCDMPGLEALAKDRGIALVEDCAQAHGASIDGRKIGSFGDLATWSFCQDKIITTLGEGGMVTTRRADLWEKIWSLKDHGKSYDAVYKRPHPPGFRWLHEGFGTNWRLTEVQSAQGRIALRKLEGWLEQRDLNAQTYLDALEGLSVVRTPVPSRGVRHAYYRLYVYVQPEALADGWSRDRIMQEIGSRGVPCFSGSCSEMYLERAFQDAGLAPAERLPVARELGETSLAFLVHPTIDSGQAGEMAGIVRAVMEEAQRK